MFAKLLHRLARKPGSFAGRPTRTRSSTRLQLEVLEDRAVPSALMLDETGGDDRSGEEIPTFTGHRYGEEVPAFTGNLHGGEDYTIFVGSDGGEEIPQ